MADKIIQSTECWHKNIWTGCYQRLCHPINQQRLLFLLGFISLILLSTDASATGKDLFAGSDTTLADTIQGTGKKYIYLAEGILSLATYIKTKNLLVLFGIVVVAVFFNMVLKIAGVSG